MTAVRYATEVLVVLSSGRIHRMRGGLPVDADSSVGK
jgi:hypothetical protein